MSNGDAKRDGALDGIRGIAIAMVLLQHYFVALQVPGNSSIWNAVAHRMTLAWSGVDLFFVLSGFLIVGILLDAKGSPRYFRTFYTRRACRIFPLYFLLVAAMYAAKLTVLGKSDWLFGGNFSLPHYLTFTQNFFAIDKWYGPNWTGITWSLAIEEQFYLVIPLLVFFCRKRVLATVFLLCIAAAPMFRALWGQHAGYIHTLARADSLLLGGLVAMGMRDANVKELLRRTAPALFAAGFFGAFLCQRFWREPGMVWSHLIMSSWFAAAVAGLSCGALPILRRMCAARPLRWLGTRSYGIYLLHMAASGCLYFLLLGRERPLMSDGAAIAVTILSLAVTFFCAELSFRWFESYFLKAGRHVNY